MSESLLGAELSARRSRLRPPQVVMQPAMMGAARLTRYSFSRTLLRRAAREGWKAQRVRFDIDEAGFSPAERDAVLGGNWLRLFGELFG